MKNLSVGKKLVFGFGIVVLLMISIIVTSIMNVNDMADVTAEYYTTVVPVTKYIGQMENAIADAQLHISRSLTHTDVEEIRKEFEDAAASNARAKELFAEIQTHVLEDSTLAIIDKISQALSNGAGIRESIQSAVLEQTDESLAYARDLYNTTYKQAFDTINSYFDELLEAMNNYQNRQQVIAQSTQYKTWNVLIAVGIVSIVASIVIIFVIRRSIMTPVNEIVKVYGEMAKGNLQDAEIRYESKDELGQMAQSIRKTNGMLVSYIQDISEKLQRMAMGDMCIEMDMEYIGDFAAIRQAIENMSDSLNSTLQTINTAAQQVSIGASQVAGGAQALASGSTEQASSIEELSVTVTKVAEQAVANSDNVKIATRFVEEAGEQVETGNAHMQQLTKAMMDIDSASGQIASITKVIEDIAFQTNILALNAAIEAARAGSAGKGFAVVADEVRNLAAKSAEAAKQTSDLIQASASTVSKGTQITAETAKILSDIREKTLRVVDSIAKIDIASTEQAAALEQIKQGLNQISAVVQTNAATAEENSATSEEMSAQAATLHEEVRKFKLRNQEFGNSLFQPAKESYQDPFSDSASQFDLSSFGKY